MLGKKKKRQCSGGVTCYVGVDVADVDVLIQNLV